MELTVAGRTVNVGTGGRSHTGGVPVVLIHGAGMDRTVWQFQARALAGHGYDVYAVDLPGHGGSQGPPPTDIEGYADWLVGFLDAAGIDQAVLVGHSMGSLIAIDVAARHPDRVLALVLLGVAAEMPVHPDLLAAAAADEHRAFELVASWSHAKAAHAGHHPTPGLWMMGASLRLLERSAPGVLHNDLAACDRYGDAAGRAAGIAAPTLFVLGEQDLMTRPAAARPLTDAIAGTRVELLEGVGHMMMVEAPDRVIDAIVAFVDTVTGRSGAA